MGLATYGAPVTSNNAPDVVAYLADFEAANLTVLPRDNVAHKFGWMDSTPTAKAGFLCGHQLIRPDSVASDDHRTVFQGRDDGDRQRADAFSSQGTFDGWREAIRPIEGFPRVRLAIYAALATPLLAVAHAVNFILSYSGVTSSGKTTALRSSASVWGCPDERSPAAAINTWDATRVAIERVCALQDGLPLIVDDTKRASRREDVVTVLYDVASGQGRNRESVDGLRRSDSFGTIMICSGEEPITSFSQDGGTRARTIELWGSPFGTVDGDTATLVANLNAGLQVHYGFAGPHFAKWLVENEEHWPTWRERYRQWRGVYETSALSRLI